MSAVHCEYTMIILRKLYVNTMCVQISHIYVVPDIFDLFMDLDMQSRNLPGFIIKFPELYP